MKIKKIFTTIFFLLLSFGGIYAFTDIYEGFDTTLVQDIEYEYFKPEQFAFVQLKGRYEDLNLSKQELLNLIYYYSITKLKLPNMPFHYVVDESGNVYKTEKSEITRITNEPYIIIAYLSNDEQMTNNAGNAIKETVDELAYTYGIEEYDAYSYSIKEEENALSEITLSQPSSVFENSVNFQLRDWQGYDRENIEYVTSVEAIEYEESVNIGDRLDVTVTFKNESDKIWYADETPIYLSVKDSQESDLAVNEIWDSFSKVTTVDIGESFEPGDILSVEFQLDPNSRLGQYSESFELIKYEEEPFQGSEFTVSFDLIKGDTRAVVIDSPEYGFVNVRECRRFSCDKVDVVNDGEVYPVVEYDESCWYKIRYDVGKEGWVYCPYVNEI
jgi:hypothetical protein